jgi:hypothetical protein
MIPDLPAEVESVRPDGALREWKGAIQIITKSEVEWSKESLVRFNAALSEVRECAAGLRPELNWSVTADASVDGFLPQFLLTRDGTRPWPFGYARWGWMTIFWGGLSFAYDVAMVPIATTVLKRVNATFPRIAIECAALEIGRFTAPHDQQRSGMC